jgi:hypothetical protein
MNAQEAAAQEAIGYLRESLKPGDTVYCILRHVSQSGMSRIIDLVTIKDDKVYHVGYNAARALGLKYDRDKQGVRISGCGMDMGFALVYDLSYRLFPNGFDLAPGERGRNGDTSGHDNDGGYALKHRWL